MIFFVTAHRLAGKEVTGVTTSHRAILMRARPIKAAYGNGIVMASIYILGRRLIAKSGSCNEEGLW